MDQFIIFIMSDSRDLPIMMWTGLGLSMASLGMLFKMSICKKQTTTSECIISGGLSTGIAIWLIVFHCKYGLKF